MEEKTKESIRKKAFNELVDYMSWMAKNYPEAHMEYMLTCPKCGKKFVNAVDTRTKKLNKYLWKPSCKCLNKDLRLSVG